MISFVIYYHSSRIENLEQTLRFLERREPALHDSELVIVCQDESKTITSAFRTKQFNLGLDTYMKPVMCNFGVKKSSHKIIALLDSDRILPHEYFTRNLSMVTSKIMITTRKLYSLNSAYTDIQIDSGQITKHPDYRSTSNKLRMKNMFSGNTMFLRDDYLSCGGMDESFVGYGYADNDMTENMSCHGCRGIYLEEEEIHLHHVKQVQMHGNTMPSRSIISATNAARYLTKWNKKPNRDFYRLSLEVMSDPDNSELQKSQFWEHAQKLSTFL